MNDKKHEAATQLALVALEDIGQVLDEAGVPNEERGYVLPVGQRVRRLARMAERAADADRWARRMRKLENEAAHARAVLSGHFSVGELAETRRALGMEEQPQLSDEYGKDED